MTATTVDPFRVVFVCTGNICRSPMAEIVFREFADLAGLRDRVGSTSAGTGDWHVGEKADQRTIEALERRGYDGALHRARQFTSATSRTTTWWSRSTAATSGSSGGGRAPRPTPTRSPCSCRSIQTARTLDVPDPYYAGPGMFDEVLGMIESASRALFRQLEPAIRPAD